MKKYATALFLFIFVMFFWFSGPLNSYASSQQMPKFSLIDVRNGGLVDSDIYKGKVLLISFFATFCPPCVQEVPVFNKLQREYSGVGFSVVGLSVDNLGPAVVEKFIEKHKIEYPVVMADRKTAMDFGGVAVIPTGFLVDKNGNVVRRYTGYVSHKTLENHINDLLK